MLPVKKMLPHTVFDDELAEFEAGYWLRLASSVGSDSHKSLEVSLERVYRVMEHKVVVYTGDSRTEAIAVYNSLP